MRRRGLDGRAADGPDVGRRGEAAHLDDLWRHPVGRADDRVGLRVEPRETDSERVLILAEPEFFKGTNGRRDVKLTVTDDQGAQRTIRYRMFGPSGG